MSLSIGNNIFFFRKCREKYYKHQRKEADQPHKYINLIVDNMDQAKTRLPRFSVQTKVSYITFFFYFLLLINYVHYYYYFIAIIKIINFSFIFF